MSLPRPFALSDALWDEAGRLLAKSRRVHIPGALLEEEAKALSAAVAAAPFTLALNTGA